MDIKKMAEDLEMESGQFMDLLKLFLDQSNSDLERLEDAVKTGDNRGFAEISHSIKGAAVNLGIIDVYEIAKNMESRCKEGTLDGESSITALKTALNAVVAAMNR
jgi:HPt (histidine-containing phosphotransfer) domain-containing protein